MYSVAFVVKSNFTSTVSSSAATTNATTTQTTLSTSIPTLSAGTTNTTVSSTSQPTSTSTPAPSNSTTISSTATTQSSTGSSTTTTSAGTFTPTPSQVVGGWEYLGCANETAPRALSAASYSNATSMTTESCQAFCSTGGTNYGLAATEYSSQCKKAPPLIQSLPHMLTRLLYRLLRKCARGILYSGLHRLQHGLLRQQFRILRRVKPFERVEQYFLHRTFGRQERDHVREQGLLQRAPE